MQRDADTPSASVAAAASSVVLLIVVIALVGCIFSLVDVRKELAG